MRYENIRPICGNVTCEHYRGYNESSIQKSACMNCPEFSWDSDKHRIQLDSLPSKSSRIKDYPKVAQYFETFCGNRYYRDYLGNVYTKTSDGVSYCSVLKKGHLTEDKAEPYYIVTDVILVD